MALQDLTPQLRTRLSRMERAVGWFVVLAVALLVSGFGYYMYNTAKRKGWFRTKAPYFTFTASANGLKPGDPVTLIGLPVGQITKMDPMPPQDFQYNMYVEFELNAPYFGYIWTEGSHAIVAPASLLGSRTLEVSKGTNGYPTYVFNPLRNLSIAQAKTLPDWTNYLMAEEVLAPEGTNLLAKPFEPLTNLTAIANAGYKSIDVMVTNIHQKLMTGIWNDEEGRYDPYKKGDKYWLRAQETPAATEQLQGLIAQVQRALPGVFNLTNQLATLLSNSANLTSNLNVVALGAQPAVSNLTTVLGQINHPGALGELVLPSNILTRLETTLTTANASLTNANTNLTMLASNLNQSLENLASMTANLNEQVIANPTLLRGISDTVVHADQFIQGLKRFWLFKHLFPDTSSTNTKSSSTNDVPTKASGPLHSPKGKD
ncbi:MAG TPA: MlaD family protein [Candidatus Limnocylindrales bacterium]|jgi:ABC-type transporter Mla subunit MlaD|nr:MlaD family protein [Candidatus Limnocylindrales bacterium]